MNFQDLDPSILEIVRSYVPSVTAEQLLNVQPMNVESAQVFSFQYVRHSWYKRFGIWFVKNTLCRIGLHPFQSERHRCWIDSTITCDCCQKDLQKV